MSLTYGQVKNILAQYQGKGGKLPTAEQIDLFVKEVLQYLLYSGSYGAERVFEFTAQNGVFTAPYELEVPIKVRVDGRVGTVANRWFTYRSGNDNFGKGCFPAHDVLLEDPNIYYTVYDLPSGGAYVGVQGIADEPDGAYIIISGRDVTGREIFTNHKGGQLAGELLEIRCNTITWSNVRFGTIDSIVKTRTVGYTPLHWTQDKNSGLKGFLSDYSPIEENPSYRRFKINIPQCPQLAKVSVLGRVRLKEKYADNERIPFDNLHLIRVAGQQVQSSYNDNVEIAVQKDEFVQKLANRESTFKKPNNGSPIEVFHPLSAGIIQGIVRK